MLSVDNTPGYPTKATVWCQNAIYSGDLNNMEPTAIRWLSMGSPGRVAAVSRLGSDRGVFVATNSSLFYGSMSYEYISQIAWEGFRDIAAY